MRRKYLLITLLSCAVLLYGCSSARQSTLNDGHNSLNSLDWSGNYYGVLPCADCEGIDTRVQLRQDNSFVLTQKYLGRRKIIEKFSGSFSWAPNGSEVILKDKSMTMHFKVGENRLVLLDGQGREIKGALSDHYMLIKESSENSAITEKYWKLLQLNGETVKVVGVHEPYIILKQDSAYFKGSGGCNEMGGDYVLDAGNAIHFKHIRSTEKACKSLNTEEAFLKTLNCVDHFSLNGDSLSFQDGGKTVARFVAVYLQ